MPKASCLLITTCCLLIQLSLWAQPGNVQTNLKSALSRADELFKNYAYREAADWYKMALRKSPDNYEILFKIAESYRKLNDSRQAEEWYARLATHKINMVPEHKLYYAQALQRNGKYIHALHWFQEYLSDGMKDGRVSRQITGLNELSGYYRDSAAYQIKELAINSPGSDFAPAFYRNGLVFVSAQRQAALIKQVHSWDDTPLLDLYYSPFQTDGSLAKPQTFDRQINSKLHEGPAVFFDQDRKMIFTRSNFLEGKLGKSKEGVSKLKLFYAEQSGKEWVVSDPFPFNNNEYSVGNPTISSDGKTLYFVSDMPGGYGGLDIYTSTYENGRWSAPRNLGSTINTEGNETFPFLYADQVLYFSSDGHSGLGGLDIYKIAISPATAGAAVVNLGYPINTQSDDFAFILDKRNETGYFSSNRKGGKGSDDVYQVIPKYLQIEMLVMDAQNGDTLRNASLRLFDSNSHLELAGGRKGDQFVYKVIPGAAIILKAQKENYSDHTMIIPTASKNVGDVIAVRVNLQRVSKTLQVHCYEEENSQPMVNAKVYLLNEFTSEERFLQTDTAGNFSFPAERKYSYALIVEKGDYSAMMTGIQPDSIGQMIKLPLLQVPSQTAQASFVTLSVEVQKKGTKQYLPGVTVLVEEGKKSWQKAVSKAKGPSFFRLDRSKRYTLRSESDLYEYEKTVIVIAPGQYAAADTVKVQLDMGVKKPDNIISVQVYDNQTGESLGEQEIMTLEYITEEAVSRIQIPQRRNIPRAAPIASDSPEAPISLTATVKDASNENLIDGAMIKLYEGSAYQSVTVSENNGSAIIQIQSPGNYALKTFKEGYLDKVLLLSTINKQPGEVMHLQINMEPQPVSKTLQVHSYEEGSSKPLANAKVYLLNEFTSEERCLQTDSAGNFSFPADPKYSYAVIVEKGNYSGMMTDIQPDSIKQMINLPVLQVVPQTSQTAFITLAVEVQEEGTEQRLPGVTVRVEEGMQPRQKAVSQAKEEMLFRLPATGHFNLKIQKENYHAKVVMVPWPVNGEETVKMIVRLQKELVSKTLQVHCYEEESSKPLANAKVYLLNEFTSEEKFLQTDSAGNFSFPAEPRYFYAVIVEKGDYTGMITDIQPDSIRQIINLPAQNVRLYNSHTGKPAVLAQTTSARQSSELTSDLVPSWPVSGRPAKSSPSLPADSLAATVAGTQKQRATTQPRTLRTTQAGDARTVAGTQKRQELPQPDTLRKEDPISGRPAKSSSAGWGARTIAGTQKQRATIQPDTLRTTQVGDARTIAGTPNRRQTAQPDTLRKEEFNAGNIKQKVVLTMPSVYYKPDKYTVANEMTAQLDSIAELMKEDAQYKLIISSYTDSRQSHWYNEQLSAKRSQAARQYLVAKGVNKKRIMNKYYGERMLVNECKDGIDCEEAKHQENRRTDFTLYLPNRVAKRKSS